MAAILTLTGLQTFHVEEADDDVGDLHAGIVDVVLHLDGMTSVAKDARHGVAENCVSDVADVRGFIRIDAGVLDDYFSGYFLGKKWRVTSGEWREIGPECGAIKIEFR